MSTWYSFVGSHFEQYIGTIVVRRTLTIELEFVMINAFFVYCGYVFLSQPLVLPCVLKLSVLATSMRSPIAGLNMATRLL